MVVVGEARNDCHRELISDGWSLMQNIVYRVGEGKSIPLKDLRDVGEHHPNMTNTGL